MATDPLRKIFEGSENQPESRWDDSIQGYMTVSDVGRMAMGSSRSEFPLFLDQYIVNSTKRQNVRFRDPSYLWRKAFYVVLFTFQNRRRYEHRKIGVLDTKLLYLNIEPSWAKLVMQAVRL